MYGSNSQSYIPIKKKSFPEINKQTTQRRFMAHAKAPPSFRLQRLLQFNQQVRRKRINEHCDHGRRTMWILAVVFRGRMLCNVEKGEGIWWWISWLLLCNENKSTALRISACHLGFEAKLQIEIADLLAPSSWEKTHEEVFGLLFPSHFSYFVLWCNAFCAR